MAVDYALVIKTRAGAPVAVLTGQANGFRQLSYTKEVNAPGLLIFDLDADHAAIADLEQDGQVEVWRWDDANGIAPYVDFEGLFVDEERNTDDDGNSTFRAFCPGQIDLLAREIVAWFADTTDRSIFSSAKAETILKTLVTYNATAANATTGNGRIFTTDIANISVEADGAGGNTITYACAYKPLLEALQDVARIGDRDFYLTRTGAQAWEFRTKQYLGTDRSASVTFALNYGNMGNPLLRRNRLDEKTRVVVGGQGLEGNRVVEIRTGANYDSTFNSKTVFYAATQYSTTGGLQAAGDIRLDELRARDDLTWDVIQTPGSLYGVHYFLGDLVTGYFQAVTAIKQIMRVSITFAPSNERAEVIRVEAGNV